ncbi:MAG: hypothetical protein ACP5P3_01880 [Ignavibacteria bacterium]
MKVTVDISYYPLVDNYVEHILNFIERLRNYREIDVRIGSLSSLVIGELSDILKIFELEMSKSMEKFPSVFTLKIVNSCNTER